MANRKLVRPNLAEIKERLASRPSAHSPREGHQNGPAPRRKSVPPEQTAAETFYYLKQMNNKTAMVIMLDTGDEIRGHIEWYDRGCIKVHREDGPNMLIYMGYLDRWTAGLGQVTDPREVLCSLWSLYYMGRGGTWTAGPLAWAR